MDPDACLARLLDAFRDGDREAAFEAIEALSDWLASGGLLPADPRPRRSAGDRIHALGAEVKGVPTKERLATLVPQIARLWAEVHEADPTLAFELRQKLATMEIVRSYRRDTP